jgi:hypothetical protein
MLTDKILICTMEFSSSAFHSMFLNGLLCVRFICMDVVEKIGGEKERAHIEIFGDVNGESIFLPVQNVHKLCVAHAMGMKKWQQRRCTQTRDADKNIYQRSFSFSLAFGFGFDMCVSLHYRLLCE